MILTALSKKHSRSTAEKTVRSFCFNLQFDDNSDFLMCERRLSKISSGPEKALIKYEVVKSLLISDGFIMDHNNQLDINRATESKGFFTTLKFNGLDLMF